VGKSDDSISMDSSAKSIKPIGDRVLLRLVEIEKKQGRTKSGLILPNQEMSAAGQAIGGTTGQVVFRAYVDSVGEKVKMDEVNFKIGDWVVFNNYDVMGLDLPDPSDPTKVIRFGMTKPESIWGIYKE
jgi:co-chaperonin GroES (HSP10)